MKKADVSGKRFALVAARWHEPLVDRLIHGAGTALERRGVEARNIEVIRVPGSFEVATGALFAAESGRFDAVIGLGVVIRGATLHFELIAAEAARGIASIPGQTGVPATFGIVTAETDEEAAERCGGSVGNRGEEAALAAVEMVLLRDRLLGPPFPNERTQGENRPESSHRGLRVPSGG